MIKMNSKLVRYKYNSPLFIQSHNSYHSKENKTTMLERAACWKMCD